MGTGSAALAPGSRWRTVALQASAGGREWGSSNVRIQGREVAQNRQDWRTIPVTCAECGIMRRLMWAVPARLSSVVRVVSPGVLPQSPLPMP